MLHQQLSRLLTSQARGIILKRSQHVPALLPAMLRSCIFHLSRIHSSANAAYTSPPLQYITFPSRSFSASSASCAAKKTSSKVSKPAGSETCQVFNNSEMLMGQMTIAEAEDLARKENMKLVDMGVNADGLRSFRLVTGKELAEESKRQRMEKKAEKVKEKEFRVTSNITDHDLDIKMRQAKDVLMKGVQVKFVIKAHKRSAQVDSDKQISQLLKKVTQGLEEHAVVKQGVRTHSEQQLLLRPLSTAEK